MLLNVIVAAFVVVWVTVLIMQAVDSSRKKRGLPPRFPTYDKTYHYFQQSRMVPVREVPNDSWIRFAAGEHGYLWVGLVRYTVDTGNAVAIHGYNFGSHAGKQEVPFRVSKDAARW